MPHREDIREFLESLVIEGSAIDWGSGAKPVMNYVKGNRAMFHTIDKNPLVKPDTVADITDLINVTMADYAFCMEVLEHVEDPDTVMRNIYYNLKVGGKLYLSVPFLYPEHGEADYWRFTSQGLRLLAERVGFKDVEIKEITDGFIMEAKR